MSEPLKFTYPVDGDNFTSAGQASVQVKKVLRRLGLDPETIRRVSIAMYEGEINMVIHAGGGEAEVLIYEDNVQIILRDKGPGIADIEQAMQPLFTTCPEGERAGLGFAVMESFTDKLRVKSAPGKGTSVTMVKQVRRRG